MAFAAVARPSHRRDFGDTGVGAHLVERAGDGVAAARALEFLILTAARTMEVIGAKPDELKDRMWTVPAVADLFMGPLAIRCKGNHDQYRIG
jgi:hypothetical protein